MTEFIPTRDRLLVKKIEDDLRTKSGLQLSEDMKERPTKGVVLEVGPGDMNDQGVILPMSIKKGDTILYPKYAGQPVKINKDEFLVLDEKEVLGVFKGEENNG